MLDYEYGERLVNDDEVDTIKTIEGEGFTYLGEC